MSFQPKRGTQTQNNSYTGSNGELTIDVTAKQLRLHDGVTPGGIPQVILDSEDKIPYDVLPPAVAAAPTPVSPSGTISSTSPSLQVGSFSLVSGMTTITHTHTQWQVATDAGFTNLVLDTGDTTDLLSRAVTGLSNQTTYFWRARFKTNDGGYSPWSAGTTFTTAGLYVDDVFSTYLYTGTGSTQTINNGIDLAGQGGTNLD
jgi:hypothetical protein